MITYVPLYVKRHLTMKEKLIQAEMNSYGYTFGYIKKTSRFVVAHAKWTTPQNHILIAMTSKVLVGDTVRRGVFILQPEIDRMKKIGHRFSISNIMVHELAHVILLEDKIYTLPFGDVHDIKFCEVYSDLCHKYNIRYPTKNYYLD